MRVAIIHYWLVGMRGGEKVLKSLCNMYPSSDIFTHVYRSDAISACIKQHKINTTFISRLPFATRLYKKYLPLMPLALEQIDLGGYDLIISSESGPAKGVIPPPGAVHICYCHSPMRYIWNMYADYKAGESGLTRLVMPGLCHYLRMWDQSVAARVDDFVANSATVAERIRKYYRRDSCVIAPPVAVDKFGPVEADEIEDYYLMAGELVSYKQPEIAVQAFNRMKKPLIVIGGGELLERIKKIAEPNVTVLGPQSTETLARYFARCKALIFPGEEDFGIVPVEVMASGRPVIAFARGGATETVIPGVSGLLFQHQSVEALIDAVCAAEHIRFDPQRIVALSKRFSRERFETEMKNHIEMVMNSRLGTIGSRSFDQDGMHGRRIMDDVTSVSLERAS